MRTLAAAVCLLLPAAAGATLDSSTIAVPPLAAPPGLGGVAGLIALQGATEAAKQAGTRVIVPDDVEKALGADGLKRLNACQTAAACVSVELASLGAGRALVGTLDRDEVHYVVHLAFVDLATAKTIAAGERTVLIAGRTLESEVAAMLPDLLSGKSQLPSKLTITSNAKNARVTLDDSPLGPAPVTVEVSPGKHEVKVEKANYLPSSRYIEVGLSDSQAVAVPITLLPNRVDPDAAVAEPPPGLAASGSEAGSNMGIVPSIAAAGIAAAALGVAIGFGVAAHNVQVKAVDTTGDGALSLTRAQALSGQRDALIANVCYVGAGVAAAGAVVLFILRSGAAPEPPAPAPKAAVLPIPGGAAVALAGAF